MVIIPKNPKDITITISSDVDTILENHAKYSGYSKGEVLQMYYLAYVLEDKEFIKFMENGRYNTRFFDALKSLRLEQVQILEEKENKAA